MSIKCKGDERLYRLLVNRQVSSSPEGFSICPLICFQLQCLYFHTIPQSPMREVVRDVPLCFTRTVRTLQGRSKAASGSRSLPCPGLPGASVKESMHGWHPGCSLLPSQPLCNTSYRQYTITNSLEQQRFLDLSTHMPYLVPCYPGLRSFQMVLPCHVPWTIIRSMLLSGIKIQSTNLILTQISYVEERVSNCLRKAQQYD